MIFGKTLLGKDGISNDTISDMTGVETIKKFLRESRDCDDLVDKMDDKIALVKAKNFVVEGSRIRWKTVIEKALLFIWLQKLANPC